MTTDDMLSFNILTIDRSNDGTGQTMRTVQVRPQRSADLVSMLSRANFSDIRLFGGISMDEYDPQTSKDLVVIAKRTQSAFSRGQLELPDRK